MDTRSRALWVHKRTVSWLGQDQTGHCLASAEVEPSSRLTEDGLLSFAPPILDRTKRKDLATFEPKRTMELHAKADAVIDLAKRLHDWPLLESAVGQKMEEQEEFVRWWRENVRGRGEKANSADRGFFVNDAESTTGITKPQVSKWAKRLRDKPAYSA